MKPAKRQALAGMLDELASEVRYGLAIMRDEHLPKLPLPERLLVAPRLKQLEGRRAELCRLLEQLIRAGR